MNLIIGIDFSYNSCGVTFSMGDTTTFLSLLNKNVITTDQKINGVDVIEKSKILVSIKDCVDLKICDREPVPKPKQIGLLAWERLHMLGVEQWADFVNQNIVEHINKHYNLYLQIPSNIYIAIENYIFGKMTDNIVDTVEHTYPVKKFLIKNVLEYNINNFYVVPAPTVKSLASKGNYQKIEKGAYDKYDMFQAFLKEDLKHDFKDVLLNNQELYYKPKIKKGKAFNEMLYPIPDIIDSYWINRWLLKQLA